MALDAVDLFPGVVSPLATGPRRLDGLAVDAAGAGFRLFPGGLAHPRTEGVMNPLPPPRTTPLMEVIADRPLRGKVVRQGRPGAPGTQDVEDRIQDLSEVGFSRCACGDRRRQQRLHNGPLGIVEIAGIRLARLGVHAKDSGEETLIASRS